MGGLSQRLPIARYSAIVESVKYSLVKADKTLAENRIAHWVYLHASIGIGVCDILSVRSPWTVYLREGFLPPFD